MHMVRNALDHGIETPDERVRNGKPRIGTVSLSATHAGGSIHIEIKDDGKGLDANKLVQKAIEKGVLPPGTVLSEEQAYLLIFAAGFSTAAAVTDISGRGVGMDVVRNNIESMRGTIRIDSELGVGTTFRIELPLTLAIMDGIETIVGSERFIIPTLAVLEFMKPEPHMITQTVGKGETFFFRGSYLPLFRLGDLFDIERDLNAHGLVIVIENGAEQVAIMVDSMVGTCQTVIKGLGRMFDEARGFAGCAIMPNGNIGLIVDVRSLIQLARAEYGGSGRFRTASPIMEEVGTHLH
jgi:two-component system chemotaxis sensor kinase CheA